MLTKYFRRAIQGVAYGAAILLGAAWVITGVWGFLLSLGIIAREWGLLGTVVALFLLPVAIVAAPLYAGLAHGDWFPVILMAGGTMAFGLLGGIAVLVAVVATPRNSSPTAPVSHEPAEQAARGDGSETGAAPVVSEDSFEL